MDTQPVEKVAVVVDLSRYSDITKELEQQLDVTAVASLNKQIQAFIANSLAAAGMQVDGLPYKGTGDGAIIIVDTAEQAAKFAEELQQAASLHNQKRDVPLAQRHFRVGICVGPILLQPQVNASGQATGFEFAATSIGNAVRLEGACRTGEVLISSEAWSTLPASQQHLFGPEEEIRGKRTEVFQVRRRRVANPATWDLSSSPKSNHSDEVLQIHRRRLAILQQQAAQFGPLTPPYIILDIEDTKRKIADLER